MKVKVSPPYPGAGSFEVEAVASSDVYFITKRGERYPKQDCELIPSVTPEKEDIVEVWDGHEGGSVLRVFSHMDGDSFMASEWGGYTMYPWAHCRVLARKVPDWEKAKEAIKAFGSEWCDSDTDAGEREAYETFIRAILGGEYGRVDHE